MNSGQVTCLLQHMNSVQIYKEKNTYRYLAVIVLYTVSIL
jgi:hypothetical protein